jgi:Flp pilus assembly protein TadD
VFNLARAQLACGDLAGARAALERLIELVPQQAQPHLHLGVVLERLGELDAARAAVERALALDPDLAPARRWLEAHPPQP